MNFVDMRSEYYTLCSCEHYRKKHFQMLGKCEKCSCQGFTLNKKYKKKEGEK